MSTLTTSTQLRLAQVIQAIGSAEVLTEKRRQVLASLALFEPSTAFQRLDQSRIGSLKLSDVTEFLDDNRISSTWVEQTYLFKQLDRDRDGRVSLNDFIKFSVPNNLKSQVSARQPYLVEQGMLLPADVETALAELFNQEVLNYRTVSSARANLVTSLDYTSLEAFKSLDLFNLGYVTFDSLNLFMKQSGMSLSLEEGDAFFRAVDLDEDGKISYSELIEAVHLLEPLPYRVPSSVAIREAELQASLQRSRSLERIYYPYYPYYFSPYYPYYYPSYYPYLRLQNLRESSLERLRQSRLNQLESESRINQLENERRRSQERILEAQRLKQLSEDSYLRQIQLEEQLRQKDLDRLRQEDLRRSREKLLDLEYEQRLKQVESEAIQRDLEREARFLEIERQTRENERRLAESELSQSDYLRKLEDEVALSRYYPYYTRDYIPYYLPNYPYYAPRFIIILILIYQKSCQSIEIILSIKKA